MSFIGIWLSLDARISLNLTNSTIRQYILKLHFPRLTRLKFQQLQLIGFNLKWEVILSLKTSPEPSFLSKLFRFSFGKLQELSDVVQRGTIDIETAITHHTEHVVAKWLWKELLELFLTEDNVGFELVWSN